MPAVSDVQRRHAARRNRRRLRHRHDQRNRRQQDQHRPPAGRRRRRPALHQPRAARAHPREDARHRRPAPPGHRRADLLHRRLPRHAPTEGNSRVLAVYDTASQALGYGPVTAMDPGLRGAGDISFVAPFTDGLEGLGALGEGDHSPGEWVNLKALLMQTERAALTIARLGNRPARQFHRELKAAPGK